MSNFFPPQGENVKFGMMPPRTGCDSTFPSSLKEISGINDRPLLRTDQKHARTKTVLGGAGQSSMFAPKNNRENKNVPFDHISPEPKRCWEVRANRACLHPQNNRGNNNVQFDRISPTPILNAISKCQKRPFHPLHRAPRDHLPVFIVADPGELRRSINHPWKCSGPCVCHCL